MACLLDSCEKEIQQSLEQYRKCVSVLAELLQAVHKAQVLPPAETPEDLLKSLVDKVLDSTQGNTAKDAEDKSKINITVNSDIEDEDEVQVKEITQKTICLDEVKSKSADKEEADKDVLVIPDDEAAAHSDSAEESDVPKKKIEHILNDEDLSMLSLGGPKIGVKYEIEITSSLNLDGTFWASHVECGNIQDKLEKLSDLLRASTKADKSLWNVEKVDEMVCVKSTDNGLWMRAVVSKEINDATVKLLFIDVGRTEDCQRSRLCKVPKLLAEVPYMAFYCTLFEESVKIPYEGKWRFNDLCKSKVLSFTCENIIDRENKKLLFGTLKTILDDPPVNISEDIKTYFKSNTITSGNKEPNTIVSRDIRAKDGNITSHHEIIRADNKRGSNTSLCSETSNPEQKDNVSSGSLGSRKGANLPPVLIPPRGGSCYSSSEKLSWADSKTPTADDLDEFLSEPLQFSPDEIETDTNKFDFDAEKVEDKNNEGDKNEDDKNEGDKNEDDKNEDVKNEDDKNEDVKNEDDTNKDNKNEDDKNEDDKNDGNSNVIPEGDVSVPENEMQIAKTDENIYEGTPSNAPYNFRQIQNFPQNQSMPQQYPQNLLQNQQNLQQNFLQNTNVHQNMNPSQNINVPQNMTNVPQNMRNVPQNMANVPQNMANVPQNMANVPQNMANVPPNMANVPQNVNVPQNMVNVPQNMANVPQNMANVPQNMTNVSQNLNVPQNADVAAQSQQQFQQAGYAQEQVVRLLQLQLEYQRLLNVCATVQPQNNPSSVDAIQQTILNLNQPLHQALSSSVPIVNYLPPQFRQVMTGGQTPTIQQQPFIPQSEHSAGHSQKTSEQWSDNQSYPNNNNTRPPQDNTNFNQYLTHSNNQQQQQHPGGGFQPPPLPADISSTPSGQCYMKQNLDRPTTPYEKSENNSNSNQQRSNRSPGLPPRGATELIRKHITSPPVTAGGSYANTNPNVYSSNEYLSGSNSSTSSSQPPRFSTGNNSNNSTKNNNNNFPRRKSNDHERDSIKNTSSTRGASSGSSLFQDVRYSSRTATGEEMKKIEEVSFARMQREPQNDFVARELYNLTHPHLENQEARFFSVILREVNGWYGPILQRALETKKFHFLSTQDIEIFRKEWGMCNGPIFIFLKHCPQESDFTSPKWRTGGILQVLTKIGSKSCCQVRFISTAVTIETVKLRTDKRTREIHPDVVRKYVRSLIKKLQEGNCENMFLSQEYTYSGKPQQKQPIPQPLFPEGDQQPIINPAPISDTGSGGEDWDLALEEIKGFSTNEFGSDDESESRDLNLEMDVYGLNQDDVTRS